MRKIIILFSLLFCTLTFAQNNNILLTNTEHFIRTWGLVKYKHPNVSNGGYNMDQEFLKAYANVQKLNTKEELNTFLIQWIKQFDSTKRVVKKEEFKGNDDKRFKDNARFEWIEDASYNEELKDILIALRDNANVGGHYLKIHSINGFLKIENEKPIPDFSNENESHRMLFLSSFWNTMRYANVNIYLTSTPWDKVLTNFIPLVKDKKGKDFDYLKDELFASLDDSHSDYTTSRYFSDNFKYHCMFRSELVNDSLVITSLLDKDIALKENIALRDVIFSIDEVPVQEYIATKFTKYMSCSNSSYLKYYLKYLFPLVNDKQKLTLGIKRAKGDIVKTETSLFTLDELGKLNNKASLYYDDKYPAFPQGVGYYNLDKATPKSLKETFKNFADKKAIILDLRNYPMGISESDVSKYLLPEKRRFLDLLEWSSPAYGGWEPKGAITMVADPFVTGSKNKDYYKGTVILLVDHNTASKSEFFAMAIQQAPNCVTIGNQTSGAVMNRMPVILKDGTSIDFTSGGAFYPNDRTYSVQRNGIKIDHIVPEQATGYNSYGVIQYAIDWAKENVLK
ncbi:MAG: hypothetical protein LBI72_03525 [Flavobacteriaceae bacterium]|jgi:C-terminal processing protease CtpA/Prc|nr:hypothetical protein [Flavobacteriaceae bacterium]